MDGLDQKIIEELWEDGRKAFSVIAKKLGVSNQTVIKRYNELKVNGTISNIMIRVNLQKIGYIGVAHLFLRTTFHEKSAEIVERLKESSKAITACRTIGDHDAYAVLPFKNAKELYESLQRIKSFDGVQHVDFSFSIPGMQNYPPITNQPLCFENNNHR